MFELSILSIFVWLIVEIFSHLVFLFDFDVWNQNCDFLRVIEIICITAEEAREALRFHSHQVSLKQVRVVKLLMEHFIALVVNEV